MKLKTRLIIAFMTVIMLPIILSSIIIVCVGRYQLHTIEKTYDVEGTGVQSILNPIDVLGQLTITSYQDLNVIARTNPEALRDEAFLKEFNKELLEKESYLLVREDGEIVFVGSESDRLSYVIDQLPRFNGNRIKSENGMYLGGMAQALVKQVDYVMDDQVRCSAFIVTNVSDTVPQVRNLMVDVVATMIMVLFITAVLLIVWIYQGVMKPIQKMQQVTTNIKNGNLDTPVEAGADDEFGQLLRDFEDMRIRLKDNAEEKLKHDQEHKELISNISHDLKTPVTTIKGYAEGIIDGVADTPEKMNRYVRTIYNKANEMNTLINELTLYSKIDTNRIPYNFNTIPVNAYFDDCAEELAMELESKSVDFGYFNYVDGDVKIIADAEQLKRVIHNIVNNSLKYMDKTKCMINLRVKDVGDFVQIELEDNGKGIAARDLPNIFERFYRTDASRNSAMGGSGIGLSIVKKIIEEHGGKIWANSKEGVGTTMYFVLRKFQEVPVNE